MRKRTIVIGIAALELAAIPALAFIGTPNITFDRSHIIAAEIKSPAGMKRFFVSSNAPFDIIATDVSGPVLTTVKNQGQIGDVVFGGNTQLPGLERTCVQTFPQRYQSIYNGWTGTISGSGPAISQAVLVTIVYNTAHDPDISFLKNKDSVDYVIADACS